MSTRTQTPAVAAIVASLLALSLASCTASGASESASGGSEAETHPTETAPNSSEQSVADACSISGGKIEELTDRAGAEITGAGESLAAGEIPDLSMLGDTLSGALDEVRSGVQNSRVSAAIGAVRDEMQGFGEIEPPESLFGAPGYIASLGSQLDRLNTASQELQTLCNRG